MRGDERPSTGMQVIMIVDPKYRRGEGLGDGREHGLRLAEVGAGASWRLLLPLLRWRVAMARHGWATKVRCLVLD